MQSALSPGGDLGAKQSMMFLLLSKMDCEHVIWGRVVTTLAVIWSRAICLYPLPVPGSTSAVTTPTERGDGETVTRDAVVDR